MLYKVVFADENGTVPQFEDMLIEMAEREKRIGRRGSWTRLAKIYLRQKERLSHYPYPEDFNDKTPEDENPPVIKKVIRNTILHDLYRWGIHLKGTGNHRILYTIHDYYKVVLLHYFNKQYNGDIRRKDIEPAEKAYYDFLCREPSKYL